MARTRSTETVATDSADTATSSISPKHTLAVKTGPPPKLFILPKRATSEARIVTLSNPRHGRPARYLVCPETGMYEFTKIAAPNSTPRSWLAESRAQRADENSQYSSVSAQIVMNGDLYIATAVDPLFLVLPALSDTKAPEGKKPLFLSSDDHLDKLPDKSFHLSEILRCKKTRTLIEGRMAAICDTVEAGDENMFRLSAEKLLAAILDKAKKMSDGGLPPSMEERFVKSALEAPVLLQRRDANAPENQHLKDNSESEGPTPQTNSRSTAATTGAAMASASQPPAAAAASTEENVAADTIMKTVEASPDIVQLQRLQVAFDFICSSYISPKTSEQLQLLLRDAGPVDFSPLHEYLVKVAELRAEAMASGPFSDFSQKRTFDEEEEEARAEKKRKLEKEKRRKANESRGVRELKKVNTSGMKKMSEFFKTK